MSSQHAADNHQGDGLWPCNGMELNRCAGNWRKKPAKKGKGGSCYLLPLLLCLPAVDQESLPFSRDAPTVAKPWGPFPWDSASLLESLRGRSYPPQWSSQECCKIWETWPVKHLKKFSLPRHWSWWGFLLLGRCQWTFATFFFQRFSLTKVQNI